MDLVPIKVKIGLRPNGHADHPNWSLLEPALGIDPETLMFHGWHYDKTSGHAEHSVDSPLGFQYGMRFVTVALATAALAQWPTIVTMLNEAEAEAFWNEKSYAHVPEVKRDTGVLDSLQQERTLRAEMSMFTTTVDKEIEDALDPDNPSPGARRNLKARWNTAKVQLDINVVAP